MDLKKNYKFRYYLAGFFDGEGTISAKMNKPDKTHKTAVIYPSVEIGNTNKDIVLKIQKYFPSSIRITKYSPKLSHHKVFYRIGWFAKERWQLNKKEIGEINLCPELKDITEMIYRYNAVHQNNTAFVYHFISFKKTQNINV